MKNITKAQLYRLITNKLVWAVIIVLSVIFAKETGGMDCIMDGTVEGGDIACAGFLTIIASMTFLAAFVQCRDRSDKLINNDILSGAGRGSVFFGRYIAAMTVVALLIVIEVIIPTVIADALNGWGDYMPADCIPARLISLIFLMFRASAEVTLAAVVLKKTLPTFVISLVVGVIELSKLAEDSALSAIRRISSAGEYIYMMTPDCSQQYQADGTVIDIINYYIPASETATNIILSAVIGSVCLIAAKKLFCRRDFD